MMNLLFVSLASCQAAGAGDPPPEPTPGPPVDRRMEVAVEGQRLAYRLFAPEADAPAPGWPLLLFLHGAGERGDDLDRIGVHGPTRQIEDTPELRAAVVVAPQCPAGGWWQASTLGGLLDEVQAAWPIDERRVYVTGLSMGGYGTWALLARYPERFAAAVPICGGGEPARLWPSMARERTFELERLLAAAHVPLRVFHGASDSVVPVEESRLLVRALEAAGADVQLTVYEGVGHDSWTRTYDDPGLYAWMFSQRRR